MRCQCIDVRWFRRRTAVYQDYASEMLERQSFRLRSVHAARAIGLSAIGPSPLLDHLAAGSVPLFCAQSWLHAYVAESLHLSSPCSRGKNPMQQEYLFEVLTYRVCPVRTRHYPIFGRCRHHRVPCTTASTTEPLRCPG